MDVDFNKSTVWHHKFAELDQANPLSDSFLGHRADLDEFCAFLAEEVRSQVGRDAIFHILMPNIEPLDIAEAVTFPDAMRSFLIHFERGNGGSLFVWMCTPI